MADNLADARAGRPPGRTHVPCQRIDNIAGEVAPSGDDSAARSRLSNRAEPVRVVFGKDQVDAGSLEISV